MNYPEQASIAGSSASSEDELFPIREIVRQTGVNPVVPCCYMAAKI